MPKFNIDVVYLRTRVCSVDCVFINCTYNEASVCFGLVILFSYVRYTYHSMWYVYITVWSMRFVWAELFPSFPFEDYDVSKGNAYAQTMLCFVTIVSWFELKLS
mgnify:CR=1 FL=1